MLYLRGTWQFVSLILFSVVQVFYLVTYFFLIQFFRMLIKTTFAFKRAGKAGITFVMTALSSSLLNEA